MDSPAKTPKSPENVDSVTEVAEVIRVVQSEEARLNRIVEEREMVCAKNGSFLNEGPAVLSEAETNP